LKSDSSIKIKHKYKKSTKIFCIGLSRSGTTSLHNILSELGLKSQHFCYFLLSNKPNWDMCNKFDALGDTPIPFLFKDLDSQYPNSKFIITIRQKDKWLKSMEWMFKHGKVLWNWDENIHKYHEKFYGTRFYNKRILTRHYDNYHKEVSDYFSASPNRLLTIKLEEGFNIINICTFLKIPFREIKNERSNSRINVSLKRRIEYNIRYYLRLAKLIINLFKRLMSCLTSNFDKYFRTLY